MDKKYNERISSARIFKDIFIISLISAFSGFVLGLLFAPQTGKNFRKYLISKAGDVIDRSKFAVIEARIKAGELLEKGKEKVEEVSSKLTREKTEADE